MWGLVGAMACDGRGCGGPSIFDVFSVERRVRRREPQLRFYLPGVGSAAVV